MLQRRKIRSSFPLEGLHNANEIFPRPFTGDEQSYTDQGTEIMRLLFARDTDARQEWTSHVS